VAELRRHGREEGFSLPELLIVMVIMGIVASGIIAVLSSTSSAERRALDVRNNIDSARISVERVREVVRGAYGVCDDSTATSLAIWRQDENRNRRVDESEITRFILTEEGQLLRQDGTATPRFQMFGLGEQSVFEFFDREETLLTPPLDGKGIDCTSTEEQEGRGEIATVGLQLAGDRAPDGRTSALLVDSQVTLRNAVVSDGSLQSNRPPTASFKHTCSPPSCTFDASESHDEDGAIVSYLWEFGDGTTGSGVTVGHVFPTFGVYAVTLTVVDDGGASASETQFVSTMVGNAHPAAVFTRSCVQLTCTFDGSGSYDQDGSIVDYEWDFGDETVESGASLTSVVHEFGAAGVYSVTLTVTDNDGATGSQSRLVNPTTSPPVVITSLQDDSQTLAQNKNRYFARVRISVRWTDGAPAAGAFVHGRFGGEHEPLVSKETNAEGSVYLQANGDFHKNTTVPFTVVGVDGVSLDSTAQTYILLKSPE
jgi:prepilin-type N-terminal cleavage/methylation domain-containing protein